MWQPSDKYVIRQSLGVLMGNYSVCGSMSFETMDLRAKLDPDGVEAAQAQSGYMQPKADFDPKTAAKALMREARSGALGTLMAKSGDPYCSLVNIATAADGSPLVNE